MREESTEHLVRLYLESKDYLVRVGRRFKIEPRKTPDVDIIAVHPRTGDRILGEVKSWQLQGSCIREVCG